MAVYSGEAAGPTFMTKKTPSDSEKPLAADDRNIVAVDEAYKEAGFEDRMYLFWNKYQSWIVAAIVAVFVGLILYFAMNFLAERREAAIREAYSAAGTPEEKTAFAREHSGHNLAGAAALEVADVRFEEEAYGEAAELYGLAAESLAGHPLRGRAALGQAVAYIMLERPDDAESVLTTLADDPEVLTSARMEAKYMLASLAFERGDYERVRTLADEIESEDTMGFWSSRARTLVDESP